MIRRTSGFLGAALCAGVLLGSGAAAAKQQASPPGGDGVVNLNTATRHQLQLLPNIGEAKAARIVAFRERRKFRAVYELLRVRGIGRRTLRRLKPYLTLSGPTTLTRKVRPRRGE